MDKLKKVFGVGLTAALLASLFTVSAASTVLAANSSTGGGTVLPGGTSPAGSISFGEDNTSQPYDQFSNGSFTVTATDSLGNPTVSFSSSSVPVVTTTAGVGSGTASVVGGKLVVTISGTDTTKVDAFTVSGLKIAATTGAPKGAVHLTVSLDSVGLSGALVPTSGTVSTAVAVGASFATVAPDSAASPAFTKTGAPCGSGTTGNVNFAANGSAVAESVVAETGTTATNIAYNNGGTGFTAAHPVGTAVTQMTCAAAFPSFVTVGDAMTVTVVGSTQTWNAGVSRQTGAAAQANLGVFNSLFAAGTTVTFTITTPGVTYSTNNSTIRLPYMSTSGLVTALPTLSADLKSLTFTLATATAAHDYIRPNHPQYDVAAGVPAGTAVNINVTNSAGVAVVGNPVTIAYIGNVVVGVVSVPNVFIATTNQSAGVITLTESAAGSFTDSADITVCLDSPTAGASWSAGTSFWAVVTSGDLKLNVAGLPATQGLLAYANPYCLVIKDYTASTVASTIEIHTGSTTAPAAGGPKINVWTNATPGPIVANVYSGDSRVARDVIIAMAVFSGSPSAVALSQPIVVRGGIGQAAGSIQITEGAPGAFRPGEYLGLCIRDQANNYNTQVLWSNPQGVNAPVVTTNNAQSSLVAHYSASDSGTGCIYITIDSSSLSTLGVITISNLKYDVVSDAVLGPVFVHVFNDDYYYYRGNIAGTYIDQTVSNATVAAPVPPVTAISAYGTRLGAGTTGTFTTGLHVAKLNQYVSWRFRAVGDFSGKIVWIYTRTRSASGVWGPWVKLTSRYADSSSFVYFSWRSSTPALIEAKAEYQGIYSVARQAQWK